VQLVARHLQKGPRPGGHEIRAMKLPARAGLGQLEEVRGVVQEDRLAQLRAAPGMDAQRLGMGARYWTSRATWSVRRRTSRAGGGALSIKIRSMSVASPRSGSLAATEPVR
jgi:hypothetical protein